MVEGPDGTEKEEWHEVLHPDTVNGYLKPSTWTLPGSVMDLMILKKDRDCAVRWEKLIKTWFKTSHTALLNKDVKSKKKLKKEAKKDVFNRTSVGLLTHEHAAQDHITREALLDKERVKKMKEEEEKKQEKSVWKMQLKEMLSFSDAKAAKKYSKELKKGRIIDKTEVIQLIRALKKKKEDEQAELNSYNWFARFEEKDVYKKKGENLIKLYNKTVKDQAGAEGKFDDFEAQLSQDPPKDNEHAEKDRERAAMLHVMLDMKDQDMKAKHDEYWNSLTEEEQKRVSAAEGGLIFDDAYIGTMKSFECNHSLGKDERPKDCMAKFRYNFAGVRTDAKETGAGLWYEIFLHFNKQCGCDEMTCMAPDPQKEQVNKQLAAWRRHEKAWRDAYMLDYFAAKEGDEIKTKGMETWLQNQKLLDAKEQLEIIGNVLGGIELRNGPQEPPSEAKNREPPKDADGNVRRYANGTEYKALDERLKSKQLFYRGVDFSEVPLDDALTFIFLRLTIAFMEKPKRSKHPDENHRLIPVDWTNFNPVEKPAEGNTFCTRDLLHQDEKPPEEQSRLLKLVKFLERRVLVDVHNMMDAIEIYQELQQKGDDIACRKFLQTTEPREPKVKKDFVDDIADGKYVGWKFHAPGHEKKRKSRSHRMMETDILASVKEKKEATWIMTKYEPDSIACYLEVVASDKKKKK